VFGERQAFAWRAIGVAFERDLPRSYQGSWIVA
jgi:hypothetical protein